MSGLCTRVVRIEDELTGDLGNNANTCVALVETPSSYASFHNLFSINYSYIKSSASELAQPGLTVVALDAYRGTVAGSLCLAAKVGLASSAIIGRHTEADLSLRRDESLSLRHLAVIIEPLAVGSSDVRFRVADLRTASAFSDERGNQLEAIVADGPVFVRCAGYMVFFLLTEQARNWPDTVDELWHSLPERTYIEERDAAPVRWPARSENQARSRADRHLRSRARERDRRRKRISTDSDACSRITLVSSVPGPVRARRDMLVPGETALGTLQVHSQDGDFALSVGEQAARRGILLGRSKRCDCDCVLTDGRISRVHLLVIRIDNRMYTIDTASKNGSYCEGLGEMRILPLDPGSSVSLCNGSATVNWRPKEPAPE